MVLEDWLPMWPNMGPPLPRFMGIYWPWAKPGVAAEAAAEAAVWGSVTDGVTGKEIPDVQVTLDGLVCYTGNYGQYQFRYLVAQKYRITFSKAGYESVSYDVIATGPPDWTELNIPLSPIVPAKPTLVYAYPDPAQVATGFSPPNSVNINYKVSIPDITEGYVLIFLFGLEGFPWWVPGTPYPRFGCVRAVFAAGVTAGYYEGSEEMYAKYSTGRFSSAHLPRGVYRLLSTCQLWRPVRNELPILVETYWDKVDTGKKITVV